MKYKYTIVTKGIFSRDLTSSADTKEEIEQGIGIVIPEGVWQNVLKGKTGIVEDADYVVKIQKL